MNRKTGLILFASIILFSAAPAVIYSQTVTRLEAVHKNGQTFLTWKKAPIAGVTYNIYSSQSKFLSSPDITADKYLGSADDSSGINKRMTKISDSTTYFRIDSTADFLKAEEGLFVVTVVNPADIYYAVTVTVGSIEDKTILPGINSLDVPVSESPGIVKPVFQSREVRRLRTVEIYTHWTSNNGTTVYPAMVTTESFPYNFALFKQGNSPIHPLIMHFHPRWGNLLAVEEEDYTSDPDVWLLSPDDYLPNDIVNSFWYGYHENFDLFSGEGVPDSGMVIDYTVRRIRWMLDWALNNLPIDTNRVYMEGHSMGAIGSVFLGIMMHEQIAAVYGIVPKFDFSFINDPDPNSDFNLNGDERMFTDRLWGTVPTNLPTNDGIAVYDRLNAGFLMEYFKNNSLPAIKTFNGKNDTVVGWAEKIDFYQSADNSQHGGYYFWDSRMHHDQGTQEWLPLENPDWLYKFRLDESFPAFSNFSGDGNPGNGLSDNGDPFSSINGYLDFDETTIVDSADKWEVTIRLIDLQSIYGLSPAPNSATVDITPRRLQNFTILPGQMYYWQNIDSLDNNIQSGDIAGNESGLITVSGFELSKNGYNRIIISSTELDTSITNNFPDNFILENNFPNPFNSETTIEYSLPSKVFVTIKVFDEIGEEVETLVNEELPPGNYQVEFNAAEKTGLSSGVYFYRMTAGNFTETKKMILLR